MRILSLGLGVLLAFSIACGGGDRKYPAEVRSNFLNSCSSSGGSSSQCSCALEAIEKKYSLDDFVKLESRITQGQTVDELTSIVLKCLTS